MPSPSGALGRPHRRVGRSMGVADSPLRGRVIFVEGAPRSGTTLLTALIACHPDIAGILSESHLFDRGLGALFDNHESSDPAQTYLRSYLSRERLVGLLRDLADGVLEEMRSAVKPDAPLIVEKTPADPARPNVTLARKVECFPDARFVHIVRDEASVALSLTRSPWNPDPSDRAGRRRWRAAVDAVREILADHPGYTEVRYDDLAGEPVETNAPPVRVARRSSGREGDEPGRADVARTVCRARPWSGGPRPPPERQVCRSAEHVSTRPGAGSTNLGGPSSRPRHRAAAETRCREGHCGGVRRGDAARRRPPFGGANRALARVRVEERGGRSADDRRLGTRGPADRGRPGIRPEVLSESWTFNPGPSLVTVFFSGLRGDGARVDLSWGVVVRGDGISRVTLVSAGAVSGRPLRPWPHFPVTSENATG
jgi:hypothetical protein